MVTTMRLGMLLLLLACCGCHFDRDGSQPININPWANREDKAYATSDLETAQWRALGNRRDTSELNNGW